MRSMPGIDENPGRILVLCEYYPSHTGGPCRNTATHFMTLASGRIKAVCDSCFKSHVAYYKFRETTYEDYIVHKIMES